LLNYASPLFVSLFFHLGLIFSFSNFFYLNLESLGKLDTSPIPAQLIFEEVRPIQKPVNKQIFIDNKVPTTLSTDENKKKIFIPKEKINKAKKQVSEMNEISNKSVKEDSLGMFTSLIKTQISAQWNKPKLKGNLKTELLVSLVPTGEIVGVSILKSSGNRTFDDSTLNAVAKIKRLEGLGMTPEKFDKHFRSFTLVFSLDD
tara:strand:- start:41708 stop:42313 length:606 start_codon:yes stop_codon:yes gene_type:complete